MRMFNLVFRDQCGAIYCLPAQDELALLLLLGQQKDILQVNDHDSAEVVNWARQAKLGDVFIQEQQFFVFCCSGKETMVKQGSTPWFTP